MMFGLRGKNSAKSIYSPLISYRIAIYSLTVLTLLLLQFAFQSQSELVESSWIRSLFLWMANILSLLLFFYNARNIQFSTLNHYAFPKLQFVDH